MLYSLKFSTKKLIFMTSFIILILIGITYSLNFSDGNGQNKIYHIAYDETWYPLELDDKGRYISLFSSDIIGTIATQQHFSVELDSINSDDLLGEIDRGAYDGILSSIILYDKNTEKYISSNPYYLIGPVLITSSKYNIQSLNDLNGKTIGVIKDAQIIKALSDNPKINIVLYDYNNRYQLIEDVIDNNIDGMVLGSMNAYEYTNSNFYANKLKIVLLKLNRQGLYLILANNADNKKLIDKFNAGLAEIQKKGLYNQLLLKWELLNPEKPYSMSNKP